jgi:hypothetical protein
MGYDLHITRKQTWFDPEGPAISLAEWQELIARDPELREFTEAGEADRGKGASYGDQEGALRWDEGEIISRDPEKALIAKMAQIAAALGATVQDDDGEIYQADGSSRSPDVEESPPADSGLLARLRNWLRARRAARRHQQSVPSFKVGLRVRDPWGRRGTIVEADRKAIGGLGSVTVRFDDGHEANMAYVASGLEPDDG